MFSRDIAIGIMFLSQTTVGILGNFSVLYYYLVLYYQDCTLRSTDMILKHLFIANFFIILSHGVPHTMAAFGLKHSFNDFSCKILLYIHRLGRGVSTAMTCLLSVFQTIMISPMNSCWKDLKVKAPRYTESSISLCWILYVVISFIFPIHAYVKQNSKNMTKSRYFGFCSTEGNNIISSIYLVLFIFPEVLFSVLIICSSCSVIIFLYKHKQQVQYIRTVASRRASPESRATHSIFVLVCTFVIFNTVSSILYIYVAFMHHPSVWLVNISALLSVSFPTVSPFVFMRRHSTVLRLCFVWIRNPRIGQS
ncbi:PREDICTED: vomeronasal type-1 receptor 4-like [Chinchilla lanigera]|uniref:vomeronasal type-1 receptor 4-like n=1 Tax=Chinchilla lanigera TaxID=34839 RepID=UPI0006977B57|nr:PREDICTED: vomeronasal type-1 receptor 4-like [Chinchilla lanigera]